MSDPIVRKWEIGKWSVELEHLCENVHSERYRRPYLDNYDDLEYNEDRWREDSRNG